MPDNNTANRSTGNREHGSLELTEEIIQARAYHFYEERGREHGHDLEDWLRAEAEIFGRKKISATEQPEMTDQESTGHGGVNRIRALALRTETDVAGAQHPV